jgi:hypothetical protein
MDSITAKQVLKSFIKENQFNEFIDRALVDLSTARFAPLNFIEIKKYIVSELEVIQRREDLNFDIHAMKKLVDNCEIYAQRYSVNVAGMGVSISIDRTPTQKDFDLAKSKLLELLQSFGLSEAINNVDNVYNTLK